MQTLRDALDAQLAAEEVAEGDTIEEQWTGSVEPNQLEASTRATERRNGQ